MSMTVNSQLLFKTALLIRAL